MKLNRDLGGERMNLSGDKSFTGAIDLRGAAAVDAAAMNIRGHFGGRDN